LLEDVTLNVAGGETVVLLGTNGNGKSTLMKSIMGIVRPNAGRIMVEIDGIKHDLIGRTTEEIVDLGIVLVPEGRGCFRACRSRRTCCSARSGQKARAEIATKPRVLLRGVSAPRRAAQSARRAA